MKWFTCIFAFYILSLCAYPCQDNGEHSQYSVQSLHQEKSCSGHNDSGCSHNCSPFCFCNCCQVNTIVNVPLNIQAFINIPIIHTTAYLESKVTEVAVAVWQPPKIWFLSGFHFCLSAIEELPSELHVPFPVTRIHPEYYFFLNY